MITICRTFSVVFGFSLLLQILHETDSYYVPVGQGGVAKQAFRTLEEVKTAVKELRQLCLALRFLLQINRSDIDIGAQNKDRNVRAYEQLCQDTPKWKKFNSLLNNR